MVTASLEENICIGELMSEHSVTAIGAIHSGMMTEVEPNHSRDFWISLI